VRARIAGVGSIVGRADGEFYLVYAVETREESFVYGDEESAIDRGRRTRKYTDSSGFRRVRIVQAGPSLLGFWASGGPIVSQLQSMSAVDYGLQRWFT
jgi:hypothetical protein